MLLVVVLVVAEMKFEGLELTFRGKGLGLWMVDHVLDIRVLTSATAVTYRWTLASGKQAGSPLRCYGVERGAYHGFASTIDVFGPEKSQGCHASARVRNRGWLAVFDGFCFTCLFHAW
jgi:hypothetical protein